MFASPNVPAAGSPAAAPSQAESQQSPAARHPQNGPVETRIIQQLQKIEASALDDKVVRWGTESKSDDFWVGDDYSLKP